MAKYILIVLVLLSLHTECHAGDPTLYLNRETGNVGLGEWIDDGAYFDYESPGGLRLGDKETGLLYPEPGGEILPEFVLPFGGDE